MLTVSGITLPLSSSKEQAFDAACARVGLRKDLVRTWGVSKVSVDARHGRPDLVWGISLSAAPAAEAAAARRGGSLHSEPVFSLPQGQKKAVCRPVVCGFGPAGIFASLLLARAGARPIVLERGPSLEKRAEAVNAFLSGGELDENANVQFGEGGAGAFSDGKLTTRIGDPFCGFVRDALLRHGAPPEIAWQARPHIGTDRLRGVIASLRREIESLGGEIRFETRLSGITVRDGNLTAVSASGSEIGTDVLILAVGHSARDTFGMLRQNGVRFVPKPFSIGFRVEHLQSEIDRSLYHGAAGNPALPPGEYQLSAHPGGRGVYTFCMCPGGQVIAAASEHEGLCTNGMSYHARSGENANAAVVVGVDGRDFGGSAEDAIAFQREFERRAWSLSRSYAAPAQDMGRFLAGEPGFRQGRVRPTYPLGVVPADFGAFFGPLYADALRAGIREFGRRIACFCSPDAVLTGPETRTSSPVRILRTDSGESETVRGLYPCGEGAGYAGGIMSAAVDGLRAAEQVLKLWSYSL